MNRKSLITFIVVTVLAIAFFFHFDKARATLHAVTQTITKPVSLFFSGIGNNFSDLRYQLFNYWDSARRLQEYEKKIEELETQLIDFQEISSENIRLQKLLNFSTQTKYSSIGAEIIGRDLKPWKRSIVIDKGKQNGIREKSILVSRAGLVGRIVELGPVTSRAIFITDPDSRVSAMTLHGRSHGVVEGKGTGELVMRYLSMDQNVEVGEDVITSGVGGIFFKGVRIGKVKSIERDPDGLHLQATVKPSVVFSKLEEVLCLIS